jgi:hypothetical protein
MGGLCTTDVKVLPDPKEVLKDTSIPEWVSTGGQKLFQQAAGLGESEYPVFQGARTATYEDLASPGEMSRLTGREQRGLSLLEDQSDAYKPYLERAGAVSADIGAQRLPDETFTPEAFGETPFGAAQYNQYAPIYTQAMQPALADVSDTYARQRRDLDAAAGRTGAFGDRRGLESAELTRGEARERGKILSEAGPRGLEFASAQFERDRSARERDSAARERAFQMNRSSTEKAFDLEQSSRRMEMEAQERLAPVAQGLIQQEAQGLIGAGEAERALDQQALEMAYRDYVEQREYPFTALNFAMGALKGLPFETREFSLQRGGQFIQSPSVYGQTMGGLGALASAYKLMGSG